MKRKLTQAEYDKLSDDDKANYKENASRKGEFLLELEDDESGALTRARDREKQRADDLQAQFDTMKTELDALKAAGDDDRDNSARKKGDVKALEESYKAKIAKLQDDHNKVIETKNKALSKLLVDARADEMATRLSTVPSLLKRVIRERLTADLDGDEPETRVVGTDGKVSAMSLADLEKEILQNKEFASILVGSKASGGSAPKDTRKASSASAPSDKPLSAQSPQELVASLRAKREAAAGA